MDLFLMVASPDGEDWEIQIGPALGTDYTGCVTPPFHGPHPRDLTARHFESPGGWPGGIGEKRWLDFDLTGEDYDTDCAAMQKELRGEDTLDPRRASGRCWLRPLTVKPKPPSIDSLTFDGECALHGALELWRLPATYVIPDSFTGWVTIYYRQKGQPDLPRKDGRYALTIPATGTVRTSSDLRQDLRSALFSTALGKPLPLNGVARSIQGWQVGDADSCSAYQTFFVGTRAEFGKLPQNPALKNPRWDCSALLPVAWRK
jgi:hypothetical protein